MNCPVPLYVVVCNIIKNDQNATLPPKIWDEILLGAFNKTTNLLNGLTN